MAGLSKWVSPEMTAQLKWTQEYLADRGHHFERVDRGLYQALIGWEQSRQNTAEHRELIKGLRHAWSQKTYRAKDGKRSHSFVLKRNTAQRLNTMAQRQGMTVDDVLDALLSEQPLPKTNTQSKSSASDFQLEQQRKNAVGDKQDFNTVRDMLADALIDLSFYKLQLDQAHKNGVELSMPAPSVVLELATQIMRDRVKNAGFRGLAAQRRLAHRLSYPKQEPVEIRISALTNTPVRALGSRSTRKRLSEAALYYPDATIESLDQNRHSPQNLTETALLAKGDWLNWRSKLIITGPTGVGKSWLACALGRHHCEQGSAVRYVRASDLISEFSPAKEMHLHQFVQRFSDPINLLIVDDWDSAQMTQDGLEVLRILLTAREGSSSTIIVSNTGMEKWASGCEAPDLARQITRYLTSNTKRLRIEPKRENAEKADGFRNKPWGVSADEN